MRMMQQIYFDGAGGPDVIRIGEALVPEPGPGQVMIEVAAAGINRPDCLQRQGVYPPPPGESAIPGLEVAGRVVAIGEGVRSPHVGDEVCALLGSGGYAEYAVAYAPTVPAGAKNCGECCRGWTSRKLFHGFRQCVYARQAGFPVKHSSSTADRAASARPRSNWQSSMVRESLRPPGQARNAPFAKPSEPISQSITKPMTSSKTSERSLANMVSMSCSTWLGEHISKRICP